MFFFSPWERKGKDRVPCFYIFIPTNLGSWHLHQVPEKRFGWLQTAHHSDFAQKAQKYALCMYVCNYHSELLRYYESQLVGQAKFQLANEVRIMELKQTISPSLNQSVQRSMLLWYFCLTGAHLPLQDKAGQNVLSLSLPLLSLYFFYTYSIQQHMCICVCR